jgi:glycosyltransferase XagB
MKQPTRLARAEQLGEVLVDRGLITPEQRDWAMDAHRRTASALTVILNTSGIVPRLRLYHVLADMGHVPFIDLTEHPPDADLLAGLDVGQLIREGWLPVRLLPDGSVLIAAQHEPRSQVLGDIHRALGHPVSFNVTTDWDIRKALEQGLRDHILDEAALGLWRRSAVQSARASLHARQRTGITVSVLAYIACAVLFPLETLRVTSVVVTCVFLVGIAFKFIVCMAGARRERYKAVTDADLAALTDEDLPVYTVLAPMFREASSGVPRQRRASH